MLDIGETLAQQLGEQVLLGGISRQHCVLDRAQVERIRVGVTEQVLETNWGHIRYPDVLVLVGHVAIEHGLKH